MKKYRIKKIIVALIILIGVSACKKAPNKSRVDGLPYYNEATFTPHWLEANSPDLKDFHKIPNFSLIDQHGETITQKNLENKITVADFFFTTCNGICPRMTTNMKLVQSAFLKDETVIILSHSVTPDADSVSVLKDYAEIKGITSPNWHLLTGEKNEIYNLGRKSYFVEEDLGLEKTTKDFLHTENFVLVDKNKHIRGIYNGLNKTTIQEMIQDIKTLQKEK